MGGGALAGCSLLRRTLMWLTSPDVLPRAGELIDVSGTMDGRVVRGVKISQTCGCQAPSGGKMAPWEHDRSVWQKDRCASRWHHADSPVVALQVCPVTFGIRLVWSRDVISGCASRR